VETAMFLPKDKVDIPQPFEEEDEDKIIKKILHLSELDSHIEEIKKQLKIESLYRKGIALLKKKAYEEARKCFDEITNMDGNLKGAWLNKGFAFGKLGNINKEVECYDGALKIDEHYEKALHNRKIARKKQG
jgi:tetratricopeptide (TPR) repeat protein